MRPRFLWNCRKYIDKAIEAFENDIKLQPEFLKRFQKQKPITTDNMNWTGTQGGFEEIGNNNINSDNTEINQAWTIFYLLIKK